MSAATATVQIGANISGLTSGLSQARNALSSFASSVAAVAGGQALFAGLKTGLDLATKGIRSLGETFSESITEAGAFESIQAQFTTFYRDANTAAAAVAELGKYANTTSFQLQDVADAGAGLASVGVPADQLKESIRVLGDVAAGSRRPLAEILQPYIKTLSTGRFQTESFMQFLERGIPIGEQLKRSLNLDDAGLTDAMSKGKISAQQMVNALQEITRTGIFAGAAAAQGETLQGKISTLSDAITELKRNLGTAAATGLKPLIEFATTLANEFAPVSTAIGNVFTAATQRALGFSDSFKNAFAKAVDFGVRTFQIIEGALRNGTLWDIMVASGKLAFVEVASFAVQTFQGLSSALSQLPDLQTILGAGIMALGGMFASSVKSEIPGIATEIRTAIGQALLDAAKGWADFLFRTATFFPRLLNSSLTPNLPDIPTVNGVRQPPASSPNASGMAAAKEMAAAEAAGYPTPLTPGEVRETYAAGRKITYNTKESLVNGAIIPPANSDAFAEGTPGAGLLAAFEKGFSKQTDATLRLQQQNEKLRIELARLTEAALKNATAVKDQAGAMRQSTELTAKETTGQKEEKGAKGKEMERFTALEKIGGGRRRREAPTPGLIPLEGLQPGLKAAGGLTGGFASSPAFLKAKAEERRMAELAKLGPPQGPPAAEFFKQERERWRTPRWDVDVAPPFPLPIPGGSKIDPVVESIQRQTEILKAQGSLNVQAI